MHNEILSDKCKNNLYRTEEQNDSKQSIPILPINSFSFFSSSDASDTFYDVREDTSDDEVPTDRRLESNAHFQCQTRTQQSKGQVSLSDKTGTHNQAQQSYGKLNNPYGGAKKKIGTEKQLSLTNELCTAGPFNSSDVVPSEADHHNPESEFKKRACLETNFASLSNIPRPLNSLPMSDAETSQLPAMSYTVINMENPPDNVTYKSNDEPSPIFTSILNHPFKIPLTSDKHEGQAPLCDAREPHQIYQQSYQNINCTSEKAMVEYPDNAVTTEASGRPSLIPVRNLDTGAVRFFDANVGNPSYIREYLNIFNLNEQDVTRLHQASECDPYGTEPDDDDSSEPSSLSHFPTTHPLRLFRNALQGVKQTNETFTVRTLKSAFTLFSSRNEKPRQDVQGETQRTLCNEANLSVYPPLPGRLKSFFVRATETINNSKSYYGNVPLSRKPESPCYLENAKESTARTTLGRRYTKKQDPPYSIRIRRKLGKDQISFSSIWLLQELSLPERVPIWSLGISYDGRWLAAGTQDGVLQLWKLDKNVNLPTTTEGDPVKNSEDDASEMINFFDVIDLNSNASASTCESSFSLFDNTPTLSLIGHNATIVTCVWDSCLLSDNVNRLASASLDRTVRIWAISSDQHGELKHSIVFNCGDWATCVAFHPVLHDLVYTGALDGIVQVWRTPLDVTQPSDVFFRHPSSTSGLNKVDMLESLRMTDLITAMAVSPNGFFLCIGQRLGRVCIYEAQSLRFYTEIVCRNRRGVYAGGRKVTGIVWTQDSSSLCISTSDSRIRIIHLNDVSTWKKFKGHKAYQIMLSANFTPSENHIVSGSENGFVHVWSLDPTLRMNRGVATRIAHGKKKQITNCETERFKAFNELLTACAVGNQQFSHRVISALHHIAKIKGNSSSWAYLQELFHKNYVKDSFSTKDSLFGLVIVAASHTGRIKIFLNTTVPSSTN